MADSSAQATSVARFLAIAHIFLGFVLVCFGIADYVTRDFFTGLICFGIWTGLWMGITGILGVAGTCKEQTNSRDIFASVFMGFSITSAVFGGLIITFYSIAIDSHSYKDYHDSYYLVDEAELNHSIEEAKYSITGIILFIGILEFLLGIWAAICCCVMKVCACCNIHAQSQQMYGQIMQPTMTYGSGGPVAVPMQNPVGLGAVQTESQIPQEGQPQMIMMPVSGPMGGQPQVMQVLASGTMPTAQVSQGFEMAESTGHGKYMTLNNDQV
ncbi:uncharacterized protein [Pocillopora verrucosa]|uniref:uncharacterized protein n=1 Tax=Pocillopora verrucosa TaxID=203993 RepID=UPI00333F9976